MGDPNLVGKIKLSQNKAYYEHCLPIMRELYSRGLYEDCATYIEKIALFCWLNFPGIYYSLEMETLLNDIGRSLPKCNFKNSTTSKYQDSRKVLHICSEVYVTGGHSKLLYNWIENDKTSEHSLLSTRMRANDLKAVSDRYINTDATPLITLPQTTILERAHALKNQFCQNYDLAILHIHPDDSLCNLALSDKDITTPILFVNHADHVFWLGSTISSILIQLREPFLTSDIERRQVEKVFYLPLPIVEPTQKKNISNNHNSATAKKETIILSIGQDIKFEPTEEYNFYKECLRIAQTYDNVRIKLIGIKGESKHAMEHQHERIEYLGSIEYELLESYRSDCDIYFEGFPMPSFTATLETVFFKKPAILHYNPRKVFQQFVAKTDNGLNYPPDLNAWRGYVDRVISEKDYRNYLANVQYNFVKSEYSMENWKAKVEHLYQECRSLKNTKMTFTQTEYSGDNEYLLANFTATKVRHLDGTKNLPLLWKIRIFFDSSPAAKIKREKTVLKDAFWYFTPDKIVKFIKRILKLQNYLN